MLYLNIMVYYDPQIFANNPEEMSASDVKSCFMKEVILKSLKVCNLKKIGKSFL